MKSKKMYNSIQKNHIIQIDHTTGSNGQKTRFSLNSTKGWVFIIALVIIAFIVIGAVLMASAVMK